MMREGNVFIFGKSEVASIRPNRDTDVKFSYNRHVGLMANYSHVGEYHWMSLEALFSHGVRWFKVLNADCPKVIRHCLLPGSENEVAMTYEDFVLLKLTV